MNRPFHSPLALVGLPKFRHCLLIGLVAASTALADTPFPEVLDAEGFQQVLVQSGDVFIAGQPTEAGLKRMRDNGVTTVVSLRTDREMDDRNIVPFDERAAVQALGMKYVHIPLGGPGTPYTPEAVERFAAAVTASEGKTLLHCTVAWRASHMWTAYLVEHEDLTLDEALRHGRAINLGDLPLEGFLGTPLNFTTGKPE